jgi:CheY-like chemotaxis protein
MQGSSTRLILFVEDDPGQAKLMMRAFDEAGATRIFHASTGEQVLAYLSGMGQYADRARFAMPALVLLDLKLPDFSGLQLINAIRGKAETRRIPVVVFSGSADDKMIAAAYDAGANSYIPKTSGKQLAETVASLVRYWLNLNQLPNQPNARTVAAL